MSFEVETPILNSPFAEPKRHWFIQLGETPRIEEGRRRSVVFQPGTQTIEWDLSDGTIARIPLRDRAYEMVLVNRVRDRVKAWRAAGYPGATRTTLDLLRWWTRDGRAQGLFFAQVEAAETIIFLKEARLDFRQGISVPVDHIGEQKEADGFRDFTRYACKMATGSGKTTVMGMLCAWSILNKIADRANATYSDAVLVVCPNVTIRDRLRELSPDAGDASVYRTRDLVPAEMMPALTRGRVLVTNWHVFEPQAMSQGGVSAKITRMGVPVDTIETIIIGEKSTTARGSRYMTRESFEALLAAGELELLEDERDGENRIRKAKVFSRRWVESDTALLARVLGRDIGGKQNILVLNDEAHHAYRISQGSEAEDDAESLTGTAEDDDEIATEATVWVNGLDRIHKHRGINFCVDLSATPYFLARAGRDTARPFPWTVSDFGLVDAIESGLVKVPQLPASDTTGAERSPYYNIWEWVKGKLTPAERGGRAGGGFKPNAVLKHAAQPIAMLGGEWREEWKRWRDDRQDPRPPVFIIVCKDIKLAKVVHEWIAEDKCPDGISSFAVNELRNEDGKQYTIRVDTKVVAETDAERGEGDGRGAQGDEMRWMRFTLDTVGKLDWPRDRQGNALMPTGFAELAAKLERPLHPPGRDVRCIVSVGMLTEGWDANTVTHIVGLRPFMSQLLCEQVVGRGLRRASYEVNDQGMFNEEVAQVFGVPFEIVPYKATAGAAPPKVKRFHVHALPERAHLAIEYPVVDGYTQAVRSHVTVDWRRVPTLVLKPGDHPTIVEVEGFMTTADGTPSSAKFGRTREMTLKPYFAGMRMQEGIFRMARDLTREYLGVAQTQIPAHVLFPQLVKIVERFVMEHLDVPPSSERRHVFLAPYYGWALEILREAIQPDTSKGEAPEVPRVLRTGSTSNVDFWTSREVKAVDKSHVNFLVMDTAKWEQQAAFYINNHRVVGAFVKNAGMDFTIPYLNNGQDHEYVPDFIIRLKGEPGRYLILETKGYDELMEVKRAAAERWVAAVNADGRYGRWEYRLATKVSDVPQVLEEMAVAAAAADRDRLSAASRT
ncbi:MAG TPA: hypothetical protein VG432_10040 [Gemmatimonadaceae bacterium]|nr:hypothetical protein [Gemmatimonadaceae bacterium]